MTNHSANRMPAVKFSDTAFEGPPPKIEPTKCKYCGETYDQYNIYNGFCSYTCRARFRKLNQKPKFEQYEE